MPCKNAVAAFQATPCNSAAPSYLPQHTRISPRDTLLFGDLSLVVTFMAVTGIGWILLAHTIRTFKGSRTTASCQPSPYINQNETQEPLEP
jgi:hypothetical protein